MQEERELIQVPFDLLLRAMGALGRNAPVYRAWQEGETVIWVDRDGEHRWTPAEPAEDAPAKPARKRPSRAKKEVEQ